MRNRILPEFEDFLLSGSLALAKNAPFYAPWVSKFLAFSNKNQDLRPDLWVANLSSTSKNPFKRAGSR